jgi:ferric-dicitrate binding protein FerR (iron transport regulator)
MTEDLIFKYISGNAAPEERLEVKKWEDGSDERKKELARMKNIWVLSGLENEIDSDKKAEEIEQILDIIRELNIKEKQKAFRLKFSRYAAAIVLLICVSGTIGYFISYFSFNLTPQYTEIFVPKGERSIVTLPDGSTVQLNSESHLKFISDFRSQKRKVTLQGEAFFNVSHDKSRPFVVEMQDMNIEVLGTSFDVSCYPNDSLITTFLQFGKVKINSGKSDDIFLSPNEAYFYNKATQESKKIKVQDQRYIDWTKGKLTINSETIGDFAKKLERRFNVKIEFGDSEAKNHIYSGSIKDEDINTLLEALIFASNIDFKRNGDTIILYSKKEVKK